MTDPDCIVIGGGPAGVAAAVALAAAGLDVALFEQNASLGGAIHRQSNDPASGAPVPRAQAKRWRDLRSALGASAVRVYARHGFAGVDGTGAVLIEDRVGGRLLSLRSKALLLAVGGLERVMPRPGAELPGVMTAGGLQLLMKSTGRAPSGRILLAGSGPLLIAVAAQLAASGNSPVAVLERSRRAFSPFRALPLLAAPRYLIEAAGYLATLWRAGVRIHRGNTVQSIRPVADGRLSASILDASGRESTIVVDRIAFHDGLRPNADNLPIPQPANGQHPMIELAGDCREALGGVAAIADGRRAAHDIVTRLSRTTGGNVVAYRTIARERRAQATLAKLFDFAAPDFSQLPDETVVCRCEGRTLGDLRALLAGEDAPSPREIKLNSRVGMGACQGRFCVEWAAAVSAQKTGNPAAVTSDFTGRRWPVRPLPIVSVLASMADGLGPPSNESD